MLGVGREEKIEVLEHLGEKIWIHTVLVLEGPDVLKISTEIEAGGQSFANDCTPELPTGVASFANQYHETTLRENQYHETTLRENQYHETTLRANQ